ncbi:C-C motif chemokine 20b [Xyrichtys novacula]|uniref:C-C motif chemokine n=1 Tax=Xyrichtys novacula TaxID=13765 RepID=A0AAV1H6S7_XYRNO|nr:C-C motif chemokine 20b [Xyrichtys novacula]
MIRKTVLVTAVCSLLILSSFVDRTQSASCCLWYTRRHLKCNRLLGYTIQTINTSCDMNAVIFHLRGRFICANPSSSHTQNLMKCLDDKNNPKTQKEEIQKTTASS